MALLDIIVTHSDEPWEVGKPFFDMIEHQRCAGRDGYTVTLVQDGKENALPWHELLADYSYTIKLITIEKSGTFNGVYHVLNGEISLSKGVHIKDLNLPDLYKRLEENVVKEIILATNPTVDGETTALYLAKTFEKYNVNVTRLAYGLQMGANLDYVDPLTFSKALEGRHKI